MARQNLFSDEVKFQGSKLLKQLGPRGVLTILGLRKTTGSQEIPWPSIDALKEGFNKPHTVLTPEEMLRATKIVPSKLSVGARALCKHAHRSSEGFWGEPRGTEL